MTASPGLEEIRLLPCPFCSGAVQLRDALWPSEGDTDGIIHAASTQCGLVEFSVNTADRSVIEAWNKRARLQTPRVSVGVEPGEVERVKRAIMREIQFKEFGHFEDGDEEAPDFITTTAELQELETACENAARAAIRALSSDKPAEAVCGTCGGSGRWTPSFPPETCPDCKGTGRVPAQPDKQEGQDGQGELLPCPFCGAAANFVRSSDEDGEFVAAQCTGCGCGSGKHYPLKEPAEPNVSCEWNRRAPAPTPPAIDAATVERIIRNWFRDIAKSDFGLSGEHYRSIAAWLLRALQPSGQPEPQTGEALELAQRLRHKAILIQSWVRCGYGATPSTMEELPALLNIAADYLTARKGAEHTGQTDGGEHG